MAGISKKGKKGFERVEETSVHTGTEAWNIAQYYTGYSIALPLKDLNDLEDVARFGSARMDEDLVMSDDQVDRRRADAVQRYWQKLRQIVSDTLFKIKKSDLGKANGIYDWLLSIPKYFDALLEQKTDDVDHNDKIEVNERFLNLLLDKLVERKQSYLYLLDNAGLIFREVDEIDLDKLTKEFSQGG